MNHLPGMRDINVGMLEKPEPKLKFHYAPHGAVNQLNRNSPLVYIFDERSHISGLVRNIHVNSGVESKIARFFLRGDNTFI